MTVLRDVLRQIPLFSELSDLDLKELEKLVICKNFGKDEYVFHEGDRAEHLFIVVSGRIKIFKLSQEGKEQILQVVGPNQIFAEAAMFSGEDYPAFAQAMEDSRLFLIERRNLLNLLARSPSLALKMMSALAFLLRRLNRLVEDLSLKDVQARLAKYLLDQAAKKEEDEFTIPLKKESLAWSLGTVSETLSRNLKKLKELGVIEIKGKKIRILDRKTLLKISAGLKF